MISTPFWFSNPNVLYEKNNLFEIFPSRKFDIVRKLNAILRLSIFYSLIMYFYKKEKNYLLIPLVTAGVTWFIWSKQKDTYTDLLMERSMKTFDQETGISHDHCFVITSLVILF